MVVAVTGERLAAAQCVHSSLPGAHPKWETVTYSHSCDLGKVYISSLCSFLGNSKRYLWRQQSILSRLACSGTWFTVLSLSHLFTQALFTPPTSHLPRLNLTPQQHTAVIPASYRTQKSQAAIPGTFQSLHPCVAASPLIPSCFLVAMRPEFPLLNDLHLGCWVLPAKRSYPVIYPAPLQPFIFASFWPNRS